MKVKGESMKLIKKVCLVILVIIVIILAAGVGAFVWNCHLENEQKKAELEMNQFVIDSFQEIGEYAVYEYNYSREQTYDGGSQNFLGLFDIPLTDKSVTISASGTLKFGVKEEDLSSETTDHKITITVKKVSLLDNIVDLESFKLNKKEHILNKFSEEEQDQLIAEFSKSIEDSIDPSLYDVVQDVLSTRLKAKVESLAPDYTVEVIFKE
jgi:hypothetical protein